MGALTGVLRDRLCRYLLVFSCFSVTLTALADAPPGGPAEPLPVLSLSVLQFGTAHWELDHLQRQQLDLAHGFTLEVRQVANLAASHLAVSSGDVNGAVADLLWVQSRYDSGAPFLYLPFSSAIGDIVVPENSPIQALPDLLGKRIGVAGGPDAKGWILLQKVAQQQGIELAGNVDVQYAAPPLLSQALRRGQVDALITYWHFAARLKGEGGVRTAFSMDDLLSALELNPDLPVLGYVFPESWADRNPTLLSRFDRALRQAKAELAANPAHWAALRPLMRAEDDGVFQALREGFVAGIPEPLDPSRISDLQRLLRLSAGTQNHRPLPDSLFFRPTP